MNVKQNSNVTHLNAEKSINEQAIHWFTLMNDEDLAHQYQEAFTKWYTHSLRHRNAFKTIAKMWDKTGFTMTLLHMRPKKIQH